MDGDDKVPQRPGDARPRRSKLTAAAALVLVAIVVTSVVIAFRNTSDDIATAHRAATASAGRVASLSDDLSKATDERDRSRHEAALARAALEQARLAYQRSAAGLEAERADLDAARREAYVSLAGVGARTAQVAALHACLDGISAALNLLAVGLVNNWQQQLQAVDGVCRQAQAVTA